MISRWRIYKSVCLHSYIALCGIRHCNTIGRLKVGKPYFSKSLSLLCLRNNIKIIVITDSYRACVIIICKISGVFFRRFCPVLYHNSLRTEIKTLCLWHSFLRFTGIKRCGQYNSCQYTDYSYNYYKFNHCEAFFIFQLYQFSHQSDLPIKL